MKTTIVTIVILISGALSAEQFDADSIEFNPLIQDVVQERVVTHDALMKQIDSYLDEAEFDVSEIPFETNDRAPASTVTAAIQPEVPLPSSHLRAEPIDAK